MGDKEYAGKVYKKGWGQEACIWQSDDVAIWLLEIDHKQRTSNHCHPLKKTGLCVLDGVVRVHFMNDARLLAPGDKINIRYEVFHRTECVTKYGAKLIEVEYPNHKSDILRLQDDYGRAGKPIEGNEAVIKGAVPLQLITDGSSQVIGECALNFLSIYKHEDLLSINDSQIVILSGKLHRNEIQAIGPGDLTDNKTLARLANEFQSTPMELLLISKV